MAKDSKKKDDKKKDDGIERVVSDNREADRKSVV